MDRGHFKLGFFVSLILLLSLVGRPSFFGPCPSGLNPVGVFFSGSPSFLVPRPSGLNPVGVFFFLFVAMPHPAMRRTVTLRIGRIPQVVSRPEVIRMLAERFGTWKLLAVQFLPGFRVQLTFDSVEAKNTIERQSEVEIEGYPCQVVGGGPSLESVLIFHLPYELDNGVIQAAMQQYGEVGGIRHQLHPDSTVHSGTRVVRMVRKGPIPRHMKVEGWSAKVWYRGQPVECDICGAGHVSRVCPMRNKCRFCGEEGHFARNCPGRNGEGWGEVVAQGATDAPVGGQEGGSVDLRDNQLDELSSQDAPGSVSASACADPDSLEGATVVSQASTDVSQSVLAGLALNSNSPDAPNSDSVNSNSNCSDAPNSDSVNSNNCADLPSNVSNDPLNNEMEVIDSNCNSGNVSVTSESEIVNGNSNDSNGTVNSNGNGISESIISNNSNDNNGVVISNDNEMNIAETSDSSDSESEDGEIRSDASIGGVPSGDESSLGSVHSTDRDGFVVPLPAKRTARKPRRGVAWSLLSVSPVGTGRSRSPLVAGKHPLPPAVPSRPKSRRS